MNDRLDVSLCFTEMLIIKYNILTCIDFIRGGVTMSKIIIIEDTETIREEPRTFLI